MVIELTLVSIIVGCVGFVFSWIGLGLRETHTTAGYWLIMAGVVAYFFLGYNLNGVLLGIACMNVMAFAVYVGID